VQANLYVVGWAKRGPTGVIGSNKSDAAAVVELLVSDLQIPKNRGDLTGLFTNQIVVTQEDWQRINQAEVDAGEPLGKPREKMFRRDQMVAFSQSVNRKVTSS